MVRHGNRRLPWWYASPDADNTSATPGSLIQIGRSMYRGVRSELGRRSGCVACGSPFPPSPHQTPSLNLTRLGGELCSGVDV